MFHSPRCIIVASPINLCARNEPRNLESKRANASMLCQQNVKTMYFKTLNPRLFNLRQWFVVRFFPVVIIYANTANFQRVCLARARGNFGWSLKKSNSRRLLNNYKYLNITFLPNFKAIFLKLNKKKRIALICFIEITSILAYAKTQLHQAVKPCSFNVVKRRSF